MKFLSKLFLNNRQIFDYCNKGIVQCTIPYFLYVCPKTLLQTNPTILSSPRKKNNAAESFSFKAKAKAFRGQINECGKYSKTRLTMLRNSNFRLVFQNVLHFYTTSVYTQRLEAQPTLISQIRTAINSYTRARLH